LAETSPRRVLRDTGTDTVRGIALVNICFLLLTIGDVATLWALPVAGVAGAMIGRGVVGGAVVAGVSVAGLSTAGPAVTPSGDGRRGLGRLLPVRARLVLFRSVIHAAGSLTWYVSWHLGMALAATYAVGYAAPLLMTLIAVPMLGERLGGRRLAATGVGFLGMLVMLRPGGDLWTPVTLLLLAGDIAMAVSRTLTRVLATTETPECLAFWLLAMHVPMGVAMVFMGFPAPGIAASMVGGLLVLGVSNGVAHWLHARAAALAPIGALAPYEYTGMLWAGGLGYLLFAQVPSWGTIAGALMVAAAGLGNFQGERRRSRAERAALPGGGLVAAAPAAARRSDP
jgi:drug/metabolite transporter (DMT)-like permease